jgi:hypothetical protein
MDWQAAREALRRAAIRRRRIIVPLPVTELPLE